MNQRSSLRCYKLLYRELKIHYFFLLHRNFVVMRTHLATMKLQQPKKTLHLNLHDASNSFLSQRVFALLKIFNLHIHCGDVQFCHGKSSHFSIDHWSFFAVTRVHLVVVRSSLQVIIPISSKFILVTSKFITKTLKTIFLVSKILLYNLFIKTTILNKNPIKIQDNCSQKQGVRRNYQFGYTSLC